MNPLVSIIIPTFNSKQWISDTLESALVQTYRPIEVIVIDDGSTDDTEQLLLNKYNVRIIFRRQENRGAGAARNAGLAIAKGEYVQFLDSDDLLLPEKISVQVNHLINLKNIDAVYSDVEYFIDQKPDERYPWPRKDRYQSGNLLLQLIDEGIFLIQSALFRRKSIDKVGLFNETLCSAEDWDWILRLSLAGGQIDFLSGKPQLLYRVRFGSMSHQDVRHAKGCLNVINNWADILKKRGANERLQLSRALGKYRFKYGYALFSEKEKINGWFYMLFSLFNDHRGFLYKVFLIMFAPFLGIQRAERIISSFRKKGTI